MPQHTPNFMFLQMEDTGRHLGCYGDPYAGTPNIDKLASEGTRYTNAISHAPVCAPSRGGTVLGRYPWTVGNHYMRCMLTNPPRTYMHELVDAGYHVSWPTKLDFNFEPTAGWCTDRDNWWEQSAPDQPFFVYQNFSRSHESRMFKQTPEWHGPDIDLPPAHHHDPESASDVLPPYFPDTPELRIQLAKYYDAVSMNDRLIGDRLRWLDEQGLRDTTVVVLMSDHGRGLPREKRWCYDAGIHLPLIVRAPGLTRPGTVSDELVAWVDLAPTILSLAGTPIPDAYQGQVFLGTHAASRREYAFAGRDRMDEVFDKVRAIRDKRFHYIRNDAPGLPWAQRQWYMEQQPIMPVMRAMHAGGELLGNEAVFFAGSKPEEELYDVLADPHCLCNLAADPAYAETRIRLRRELDRFLVENGDMGETDEATYIAQGMVTDKLPEYRERSVRGALPPEQVIGPTPIPMTLAEARRWLRVE